MLDDGLIEVDGVNLEYHWIAGDPDKPIIVLLHEGLGCVAMWKNFPRALHERTGASIFVYSRQGYGGSDACDLPRPLSYMHDEAETLSAVLNKLPGKIFLLVGHSDGASIATIFVGNGFDQKLEGLVLIAPHFFVEPVAINLIQKAKRAFEADNLRDKLMRHHGNNIDCAFYGWNQSWLHPDFLEWDITQCLCNIKTPTLLIQGKEDQYGTLAQVDIAQQNIDNLSVHLLAECGHSPHLDNEPFVVNLINRHIDEWLTPDE